MPHSWAGRDIGRVPRDDQPNGGPMTKLVTTNRFFAEWREVFPNAACVVSLVDRLVHNAEVLAIEGESYRLKEAQERADQRARQRRKAKS